MASFERMGRGDWHGFLPYQIASPISQWNRRCQVHPPRQQEPSFPLTSPCIRSPSEELGPANLIQCTVGVLHHLELVIHDPAVGGVLLDAETKRLPHIDTHRQNPHSLSGCQLVKEEFIRRFL